MSNYLWAFNAIIQLMAKTCAKIHLLSSQMTTHDVFISMDNNKKLGNDVLIMYIAYKLHGYRTSISISTRVILAFPMVKCRS